MPAIVNRSNRPHRLLATGILVWLLLPFDVRVAAAQTGKPFFDAHAHTTRYVGPDDDAGAIQALAEVRIGYFGPSDPDDPVGGTAWHAACRAVQQANARGGFHGKPFRLVSAWSKNPWGTGVKELTRLVYQRHVWAIIGGVDGPTTHLAEQVVAKARLPLVSPVSTDKSVNMANVPWMFSLAPDDGRIAEVLGKAVARRAGRRRVVLVTATDHDSHVAGVELTKTLTRLQVTLELELDFDPTNADWNVLATQCVGARPSGIVVMAPAQHSAKLVVALRRAGYSGPVFGGVEMARRAFQRDADKDAEGVIFPWIIAWPKEPGADSPAATSTSDSPAELAGRPTAVAPMDFSAVLTYDATRLVIMAIQHGGLRRAEIGRQLRRLAPWQGQGGRVTWDGLGRNTRQPTLATWHDGRPRQWQPR